MVTGLGSPWERRSAPGDPEKLEINVAVWFCVMNSPAIRHKIRLSLKKRGIDKIGQFYCVVKPVEVFK